MEELISHIMQVGVKIVVEQEAVLGGQFRPLVIHYVADEGTVVERWSYPNNSAMTTRWGAINGVSYSLLEEPDFETIEL
jgi:hypothetical protein